MLTDLKYSLRSLAKTPLMTGIAGLTLALGIGSATVSFSALNALLLRPLPLIQHQERMLYVNEAIPSQGVEGTDIAYADFVEWRKRSQTLDAIWVYDNRTVILSGTDEPERVLGSGISAGAFQAMGVQPLLGRNFRPEEDQPNAAPVALLGYGLWQRRFGGQAGVVGRVVTINGQPTTVLGVMPGGWRYPETADLWVPLRGNEAAARHGFFQYSGHAMLKPGVTLAQARAEFATIAAALAREFPATNTGLAVSLRPVREEAAEDVAQLTVLLFGAVMCVFLIACANVANLLLARASARTREIALRLALGASRARLLRQLLTESLVLGLIGGAGGLLCALWGVDLLLAAIPVELPFWLRFDFDARVFGFVLVLALLASLLSGLFPALQASRPELVDELKDGGRAGSGGARSHRLRHALVVLEIALALVLLVGAGLMMRSFLALHRVQPGFDAQGVLTFRLGFPPAMTEDPEVFRRFYRELLPRLAALPGVQATAATSGLPGLGLGGFTPIVTEGQREPQKLQETPGALNRSVTPDFFATLRIPRLAGRFFAPTDDAAHPRVAIVDEEFVHRFFPQGDPLGRRFRQVTKPGEPPQWLEIVGVVGTVRRNLDRTEAVPAVYLPFEQDPRSFMSVALRIQGDPASTGAAARRAVLATNKDIPIYSLSTFADALARAVWIRRTFGLLFTVFAGIALFLASIGIYGVMSYAVVQRTHEIGVRMALGAQPGNVIRLVVHRGLQLVLAGLAGGFVAAYFASQLLAGSLYGVSPRDPAIFMAVPLLLAAVALLACLIPARRATRVDPLIALRAE